MNDHFTPRNRGSDTSSFYSNGKNKGGSAGQRIRHLGWTITANIPSFAAGDTLLDRPSVPLTENESETEEEESQFAIWFEYSWVTCLNSSPYW